MKTISANLQKIINAVGTTGVKAIDVVMADTGLSRGVVYPLLKEMKDNGLGVFTKATSLIELNEEGIKQVSEEPIVETAVAAVIMPTAADIVAGAVQVQTTAAPATSTSGQPVTAASLVAASGAKGRAPDPSSKRARFETFMAANLGMRRKDLIAHAVAHFGMTQDGAGTYVYNFNKKLKAAGIVKPQHVVAKVEIPTAASLVAQPVMAAQPALAQTVVEIQPIIEVATATEEHSTPATAIVTGTVEETPAMTADQGYQAAE